MLAANFTRSSQACRQLVKWRRVKVQRRNPMDPVPVSGLKVKEPDCSHVHDLLFFYLFVLDNG